MKTGGITGALKCNAIAEARGIGVMFGCMDESRVSMAAAAHLALGLRNVAWADLDGHIDILDDVVEGGILIENGMVRVSERPGLGVGPYL
jgi:L-alanine-DL-glutamate epimerase-like enolase superfamily enzyme